MRQQPREAASGRYQERSRSAPESELLPPRTPRQVSPHEIATALAAITALFTDIAAITSKGKEHFLGEDPVARYAAAFLLVQLGEHAKRLGKDFTARHPEPQYDLMAKQRDLLAHHLERVSWRILWETLTQHVPRSAAAHLAVQQKFAIRAPL